MISSVVILTVDLPRSRPMAAAPRPLSTGSLGAADAHALGVQLEFHGVGEEPRLLADRHRDGHLTLARDAHAASDSYL